MNDHDPLVPLLEARNEFEARTLIAVLEDSGIDARIFVLGNLGLSHSLLPGSQGIPVMIRQSQVERAQRALAESREVGASVDWDSVDVGEEPPTLPSSPPRFRTVVRVGSIVLLAGGAAAVVSVLLDASQSVTTQAIAATVATAFVIMVIAESLRERRDWNDER